MRIIIYLRSLMSPLLFAVERPLPFINCFWSVLVLTDPDQLGVTGFVKIYAFWEFLTDTYGPHNSNGSGQTDQNLCAERPHLKLNY